RQKATEAIPFGFVLPHLAHRNGFNRARLHRLRYTPFHHAALRFRLRCPTALFLRFDPDGATFLRPRLCFKASIRSITLLSSAFSSGTSIVLPAAFRLTSALKAASYLSLNLCGSNLDVFVSRMCAARSTMSFEILGLVMSSK